MFACREIEDLCQLRGVSLDVKIRLGSACPGEPVRDMEVRGRCLREGRPRVAHVTDEEIREALSDPLRVIVGAVRTLMAAALLVMFPTGLETRTE